MWRALPILLLLACGTKPDTQQAPTQDDPCAKNNILKHVRTSIGDHLLKPDGATYDLVAEVDVNGEFHVAGLVNARNANDSLISQNVSYRVSCGAQGPNVLDAFIGEYDLLVTPERRHLAQQRLDSLMSLIHNEPAVSAGLRDERLRALEYYRRIARQPDARGAGILR
ncbi:MAG: hypothetical protein H6597_05885 [Flavobacteriales bacterium]|nr:hypothetical protein [Flavobacteriales bacterium]MCB9194045.1 hypothetical protein [Flavobacteriales bacterium]